MQVSLPCCHRTSSSFKIVVGSSVDVERAFSRGRRAISLYRHSLTDVSALTTIIFGSWSQAGILPREKLIAATAALRSRRGTQTQPEQEDEDTEQED